MILIPYTSFRMRTELSAQEISNKIAGCTNNPDAPGAWRQPPPHLFDARLKDNSFTLRRISPGSRMVPPPSKVVITEHPAGAELQMTIRYRWFDLVCTMLILGFVIYQCIKAIQEGNKVPGVVFLLLTAGVYSIVLTFFAGYVEEYKWFLKENLSANEPEA